MKRVYANTFKHYDRAVYCQTMEGGHFKDFLKSEKVNYIELPILDQDVVYYKRGLKKEAYALIKSGEYENVYITDSIPLDMNWDLLVKDCEAQKSGKAPMEMVTKAKRIVDKACNDATKSTDDLFEVPEKPDAAAIRVALAGMGYGIDDLKKMDHHDIDDDFWKKLVTRKAYHKKSEKAARKQPDRRRGRIRAMMKACPNRTRFLHTKERNRINGKNHRRKDKTSTSIKIASDSI